VERLSAVEWALSLVVVGAAVALRLNVITHFNVNWDEFYYLSQVHDFLHGRLGLKVQTFHVHFFGWLPRVSANEVDQIVAARAVMVVAQLATVWCLHRIARSYTSRSGALFVVAAYFSVSFVIRGGASFRSDPLATALVMGAFTLVLSEAGGMLRPILAGLLFALAALITIKAALFLPSLVALACIPPLALGSVREGARRASALGAAAIAFPILYALHSMTIHGPVQSSVAVASGGLAKTVVESRLFQQLGTLLTTLRWDAPFWILWLLGLAVLVHRLRHTTGRKRQGILDAAALVLPVASVAVYRNSFPYFYPFILAPGSVLLALAWERLARRGSTARAWRGAVLRVVALTWFAASLLLHGVYVPKVMPLGHQRTIVGVVHRMFPGPVPYLDRSSALASFPQAGFFMSTWGMEAYRQRGAPVLGSAIDERQPPLLLADHPLLDPEHAAYPAGLDYGPGLLPEDAQAIAMSYVHHWGPIYVAGTRVHVPEEGVGRIDLRIGGRYTVEAAAPVRLDDQVIAPGGPVDLTRGPHEVTALGAARPVILRWGVGLFRPEGPPPTPLFFLGF
jgi:hypothetical protein